MRLKPHAFLRLGSRWINMAAVSDIEERGGELRLHLVSETARLAGRQNPQPVTVARQITITDGDEIDRLKQWLLLNDED